MDIVDGELQRADQLKDQLTGKRREEDGKSTSKYQGILDRQEVAC